MGALDGRVAIITGAGRGIGRAHALLFASEGAKVVVNDAGTAPDGHGAQESPAEQVVTEIIAAGGTAVADNSDIATWAGGQRLLDGALAAFGDVHVLVNNAGILRDRALVNMTEDDWDAVVNVHLKGHFVPTRFLAAYWREQHKAGARTGRAVVHTSSTSGLLANPGQTNYGSAKSAIATFSQICAKELARYAVVSNCIAPAARTRLTEGFAGLVDMIRPPADGSQFDLWDPANVSPLVAYLSTDRCKFNGATFFVQGGTVRLFRGWEMAGGVERDGRWTVSELGDELERRVS